MQRNLICHKKWFTLIEIMIVMVIIWVLMTMVFRFGGSRLQQLQVQTSKETILWFREDVVNNNRTSSYIGSESYDTVSVSFSEGTSQIDAVYSDNDTVIYQESSTTFQWMWRKLRSDDGQSLSTLTLRYIPYELGCAITTQTDSYSWAVLEFVAAANPHRYCFAIQYQTCSMQEIVCPAFTD